VKNLQREGSRRKFHLDFRRRTAWSGATRVATELTRASLPDDAFHHPPLVAGLAALAVLGDDQARVLVVQEVAARPIHTVAIYPVLLAPLSLVLIMLTYATHLLIPMCKLALLPIQAVTLFFIVSAQVSFESRVWENVALWVRRRVSQGLISTSFRKAEIRAGCVAATHRADPGDRSHDGVPQVLLLRDGEELCGEPVHIVHVERW